MARIAGVNIPTQKRVPIALTYITGIGPHNAEIICNSLNIDRARRVRAALDALEERQRQVILLAYFEGLSQTEMATRLGQPLGTVKTWTRSALQTLREQLAEVAA